MKILQNSDDISRQFSAHYRQQSLEDDLANQNLPKELITLQKFMKDTTMKTQHQNTLTRLDNQIEAKVVAQEQINNPPRGASPGGFGGESEPVINHVFTRVETKKVNHLADL